jgi:alpha-D-xyloside xylohydrolase
LLPCVYSLAADVARAAGTFLHPLVMDFRDDPAARDVRDQFLFGRALLVSPVLSFGARSRPAYLPRGARWYDFWTGAFHEGGRTIDSPAPYDSIPIHVRAGSIVPLGPELQYTSERPADPVTLLLYEGADGAFTLYEDDGVSYAYERGLSARIPLRWNEAGRTLTIGAREGSFPGMLATRRFDVVRVSKTRPKGFTFTPRPDRSVVYRGQPLEVSFR